MVHEFNKDNEYFMSQTRFQDNNYHQHDLKKIQFSTNLLFTLDYSSSAIKVYDPFLVTVLKQVHISKENHASAVVINDFFYSPID